MKKLIFSIALLTGLNASAQLPDGSIAPDFTLTDINGVSHNLYTYLNQGKTVFIDVSATWCGPCWGFHETGALDDLWSNHGPAGGNGVSANTTDDVIVIYIEGDGTTNTNDLHGSGTNTQGDWVSGVDHPIIDPASATINQFNDNYNIGYFPTIYKICPNRTLIEVGQQSAAALYATVSSCPATANMLKDVVNVSYEASTSICTPMDYTPSVKIQNNGLLDLTSAEVIIKQNNIIISTGTFSGNLTTYATATVNCSPVLGFNGGSISIEVVTDGDGNNSNNISTKVINSSILTTNSVLLTINTDGYATETSWNIKNALNAIVPGTTDPTLANNTTYNFAYTLANAGCYTFNISDSYGDGITPGTINVRDSEGHVLLNSGDYGSGTSVAFKVVHILGEPTLSSNQTITNNSINICEGESLTLTSSSFTGNVWSSGETSKTISVTSSGDYFVTAQSGNSDTIHVTVTPAIVLSTGALSEPTCNGANDGSIELNGTGTGDILWNGNVEVGVSLPFTVSNLGVGTYTFVMSNGNCSSESISAVINDLGATVPNVSLSGGTTFCAGNTLTLTSSETSNILWSTGETTASIAVTTSGVYSVSFTDLNGCLGNSQVVDVVVNALPQVSGGMDESVCIGSQIKLIGTGASTYVWDNGVPNNTNFIFNGTQTYTVIGTDVNGCSNTAQVTLTGISAPIVNAGASFTACKGASVTLSGTGADSYVWTNGVTDNIPFTLGGNGTFTVIGFAANGCSSSDQITISIFPVPQVSITVPAEICKTGASVNLVANPSGGVFSGNSGISGTTFTPTNLAYGYYSVNYASPADVNGCTGTTSEFIRVINCAGFEENEMSNISIYPNPSNGVFTISGTDLLNYEEVSIVDISGRLISTVKLNNSELILNVGNVEAGNYLVVFKGDNGTVTQKIQINK